MGRQVGMQIFRERYYYAKNYLRQFWWNIFQCRVINNPSFLSALLCRGVCRNICTLIAEKLLNLTQNANVK